MMDKNESPSTYAQTHRKEEKIRHALRNGITGAAGLLEISLAGLVLIGLLLSAVPLIRSMPGLLVEGNDVEIRSFLEQALDIVIGIEFIKMLSKHNPGSSLEVLLCAIARHMIVGHDSALENLLSVAAIALIFIIRKFFFVSSFSPHSSGAKAVRKSVRSAPPKAAPEAAPELVPETAE